jgi:hypothetical protein
LQVVELLKEIAEYVEKSEPGTLRYEIHREINKKSGDDEVIVVERLEHNPTSSLHMTWLIVFPFSATKTKPRWPSMGNRWLSKISRNKPRKKD